jgi:hypothetical protein
MASTRRIEVGRRPYGATATLETRRLKRERAPVPVFFPLLSVSSVSLTRSLPRVSPFGPTFGWSTSGLPRPAVVVNLFCNLFNPR